MYSRKNRDVLFGNNTAPYQKGSKYASQTSDVKASTSSVKLKRHRSIDFFLGGNIDIGLGISFKLSDLVEFAEFQNMWDEYRINGIKLQFLPQTITTDPKDRMTRFLDFIDYTSDVYVGTNATSALANQSCQAHFPGAPQGWTRFFKPRFRKAAEDVLGAIVSGVSDTGWIKTSSPDIPHYGYKWYFETFDVGDWDMHCFMTYYLEFRGPH